MPPQARNGPVSTSVRLACTLRYFAGGSPYDIMAKYGISHASVYESIWTVIEAVNSCDEFSIEYPASETAQLKIAHEFENVSEVKFNNCAGAIDGILIWILKNGLVLFGDNAYINTRYMATPFPNVLSGSKDDYKFFSVSAAHPC